MSDETKPNEQTVRFENKRKTEMLFGIEPMGFYTKVLPGKVIEVVFTPYKDYKLTFGVGEDGSIVLDIIADLTVFLDGLEVYNFY